MRSGMSCGISIVLAGLLVSATEAQRPPIEGNLSFLGLPTQVVCVASRPGIANVQTVRVSFNPISGGSCVSAAVVLGTNLTTCVTTDVPGGTVTGVVPGSINGAGALQCTFAATPAVLASDTITVRFENARYVSSCGDTNQPPCVEDAPNNSLVDSVNTETGDVYTFTLTQQSTVDIRIDTTPDTNQIATIDPIAALFMVDSSGQEQFLVESDDVGTGISASANSAEHPGMNCSVPQLCGYSCPRITKTLPPGTYRLKVWDTADPICYGGRYTIRTTGTRGLTLITDDQSTPYR